MSKIFAPGDMVMLSANPETYMNADMKQAREKSLFLEIVRPLSEDGFTYLCHSPHFEESTTAYSEPKNCWSYFGVDLSFWKKGDTPDFLLLKAGYMSPEQYLRLQVSKTSEKEERHGH